MDIQHLNHMRQSFPVLFRYKAEISRKFYHTLFREAPETRELFGESMSAQREMLAMVLTTLAKASFQPDTLREVSNRLARSHSKLGLSTRQFDLAEEALRSAIVSTMHGRVSTEVLEAWKAAVRRVIQAMKHPPKD